jgi:hypothetical protein
VDYLYPSFLNDPQEYAKLEAFWQSHWHEFITRMGQQKLWKSPWLNTTFADGTPFQDGNPIFSAVDLKDRIGIQITQLEPAANPRELDFWTDIFDEGGENIKILVISCVLTAETLKDCSDLMNQWITTGEVCLSPTNYQSNFPQPPVENLEPWKSGN